MASLRSALVLCLVVSSFHYVAALCAWKKSNDKPPDFNVTEFTVDVEMSRLELGQIAQIRLFYSASNNVARMKIEEKGVRREYIYLFSAVPPVMLYIDQSTRRETCQVKDLASEQGKSLFFVGDVITGKIPDPLTFFRLAGKSGFGDRDIQVSKVGPATVRGIDCTLYQSCQQYVNSDSNLNINVLYRFDKQNYPISITATGSGKVQGKNYDAFDHVYSFFNFKPFVKPEDLETPYGIYCERRTPSPLPQLPPRMSFSSEMTFTDGTTSYQDQIFDTVQKFAVMRYISGSDEKTDFREFTSGLSFSMTDSTQVCNIQNISDSAALYFGKTFGKDVRQLSMKDFLYMADGPFQYVGKRTVRGLKTDAYIGKARLREDAGADMATVEWHFASNSLVTWNSNLPEGNNLQTPIQLVAWPSPRSTDSIRLSFFNVDFSRSKTGTVDLSPCLGKSAGSNFQLKVKGKRDTVLNFNKELFMQQTLDDLVTGLQVQWWRISGFKLYYDTDDVIIEFIILDKPPQASDVSPQPIYVTAKQALQNLNNAIKNGSFRLKAYNKDDKAFTTPLDASIAVMSN